MTVMLLKGPETDWKPSTVYHPSRPEMAWIGSSPSMTLHRISGIGNGSMDGCFQRKRRNSHCELYSKLEL